MTCPCCKHKDHLPELCDFTARADGCICGYCLAFCTCDGKTAEMTENLIEKVNKFFPSEPKKGDP